MSRSQQAHGPRQHACHTTHSRLVASQQAGLTLAAQEGGKQAMITADKTIDAAHSGCSRIEKAEACFEAFQRFATRLALPFVSGGIGTADRLPGNAMAPKVSLFGCLTQD